MASEFGPQLTTGPSSIVNGGLHWDKGERQALLLMLGLILSMTGCVKASMLDASGWSAR